VHHFILANQNCIEIIFFHNFSSAIIVLLFHRISDYFESYLFSILISTLNQFYYLFFCGQVDVGDFLRFKSCVLYTQLDNPDQPEINVEVVAHVTRPELRTSEVLY
jgi:acyl-coenzyme A thioesterase 9